MIRKGELNSLLIDLGLTYIEAREAMRSCKDLRVGLKKLICRRADQIVVDAATKALGTVIPPFAYPLASATKRKKK